MPRADTPTDRRRLLVDAIVRNRQDDAGSTVFEGAGQVVEYDDQQIRVELPGDRDRLDSLLSEYRVFKVTQPDTKRADSDVVYLSAVTDPKHTADFVEALFREVFDADERYTLEVS